MELMLGALSDLLYGKLSKGITDTLTPKRQVLIVKGIAAGMQFLHDHGTCRIYDVNGRTYLIGRF